MISCVVESLKIPDERRLREWLLQPEADLLIKVLKADEAQAKVSAMLEIDRHAGSVLRGDPLPAAAQPYLRTAAGLAVAIKILQEKIHPDSKLTYSKLIIE
jgi:hypothetical protein